MFGHLKLHILSFILGAIPALLLYFAVGTGEGSKLVFWAVWIIGSLLVDLGMHLMSIKPRYDQNSNQE